LGWSFNISKLFNSSFGSLHVESLALLTDFLGAAGLCQPKTTKLPHRE
jgi:hypothetical protein